MAKFKYASIRKNPENNMPLEGYYVFLCNTYENPNSIHHVARQFFGISMYDSNKEYAYNEAIKFAKKWIKPKQGKITDNTKYELVDPVIDEITIRYDDGVAIITDDRPNTGKIMIQWLPGSMEDYVAEEDGFFYPIEENEDKPVHYSFSVRGLKISYVKKLNLVPENVWISIKKAVAIILEGTK
ncbi:MAG: hypothetical protein WC346_15095 [Methanogenium sp.]